tara:strand:+ start:675 stop:1154 length:480 start_codon:yes stop_codon:yes gene_type:complete
MKIHNEAAKSSNVVPISKDIGKKQEVVEQLTPTEERFGAWLTLMGDVFDQQESRQPDGEFAPEDCYQKGDFPRDVALSEEEGVAVYDGLPITEVPRCVVDAMFLRDIIESGYCRTHMNEFLEKSFKKYDAIYKTAHKKWLRYLVKECQEHGLLEQGEGK